MKSSKSSSRKPYVITGALFIYAVIMAIVNIDTLTLYHDYLRYFGTLAGELVVLVLLFFFLKRREQLRREREQEAEKLRSQK